MLTTVQASEIMRSMVPISRFNKGEANKIFEEVAQSGVKIAVKNNKPACILLSPDKYERMIEAIGDLELMLETEKRLAENAPTQTFAEVLSANGIGMADLADYDDVELD